MQGHTDRATINQRRPLTEGMKTLLGEIGGFLNGVHHGALNHSGERSTARALLDRGLIDLVDGRYTLTEDGRSALASL